MSQIVSDWFFFSWENNFHISPRASTEVALITNPMVVLEQRPLLQCMLQVPEPMYKELEMPALMNCGGMQGGLEEMNMWINSGGAKSIIHKVWQ